MFMVSEKGTFKDFKNIHRFQKCSQVQKKVCPQIQKNNHELEECPCGSVKC
jgi:hypothetical protein